MSKVMTLITCACFLFIWLTIDVFGNSIDDYWPTWRGPDATGAARKGNPPLEWSETKNIKWKIKLPGEGSSSPIVWADRIFFQAAIRTDKKVSTTENTSNDKGKRPFHGGKTPT
ncbi:MAG: PQQ-binding-like beta-propeller repeat protein, partial [Planctomycetota bacterium]